jgi:L-threonylcarbamoyladenylate synthase
MKETITLHLDPNHFDSNELKQAAQFIRENKTVIFPTETVYGLGANALSDEAVSKIFEAKGRPQDNPLIVHVSSIEMLESLILNPLDDKSKKLINAYWPGALTLVLKHSDKVPNSVCANLDTVGIRMPDHPIALKLIELAGVPIAAPSANLSGKPSPTEAEHVLSDMMHRVDLIITASKSRIGLESTVLDMSTEIPTLLRPGGVTVSQIESIIGPIKIDDAIHKTVEKPKSPGMKYTHYAPNAPLTIYKGTRENMIQAIQKEVNQSNLNGLKCAVITCDENYDQYLDTLRISLGSIKKPDELASNLFESLRECDKNNVDIIFAEAFDESDIGLALMNRLKKAAGFKIITV